MRSDSGAGVVVGFGIDPSQVFEDVAVDVGSDADLQRSDYECEVDKFLRCTDAELQALYNSWLERMFSTSLVQAPMLGFL